MIISAKQFLASVQKGMGEKILAVDTEHEIEKLNNIKYCLKK